MAPLKTKDYVFSFDFLLSIVVSAIRGVACVGLLTTAVHRTLKFFT